MADSTKLFGRAWSVTVGTLDVSALDISFKCKRTLKPEPNTCDLIVYNLAETTRRSLEAHSSVGTKNAKGIPVRIEAGYGKSLTQIYLGELRNVQTTIDGAEVKTELSTDDGKGAIAASRLFVPVGPKTDPGIALRRMAEALGVGAGNLSKAAFLLQTKGLGTMYAKGAVFKGDAWRQIQDFAKSSGLEVSVQNGALQFLDRGKALEGLAVKLSSGTGMIGAPTVDNKGIASVKTLLIPDLFPGRKIQIDGANLKGFFRVIECEYQGDTLGNDWCVDLKAERL